MSFEPEPGRWELDHSYDAGTSSLTYQKQVEE